jgi:glycosyltransferase involved in cell wall biosynthesis
VTLDQVIASKIVIYSHFATTGACEELRDWLVSIGVREVVYVAFPFGRCPDCFIRVEHYRQGQLIKVRHSLFRFKLPDSVAYAKDFAYALLYAVRFARGADVLVAGDNLLAWAGALSRCVSRARRIVYYMIDYTPVRYGHRFLNSLYYWVDRQAACRADAVWPLTPQIIRGRFDAGRLDPHRVRWYTVPYGSHPVAQGAAPASFTVTNVVYMGDLVRNKGAELFVPMARELKRIVPDFTFTVIGGGQYLPTLRAEVEQAGLQDHFTILGFVASIHEVVAHLVKGGVAIAPYYPHDSNSFTFFSDPGKIKVYLGCGLPIVLTDVPPIAKTLEAEGAGRIASYDAADMAVQVAALMRSPDYLRRRADALRMGQDSEWGKLFVEAFSRLGGGCSTGRESTCV